MDTFNEALIKYITTPALEMISIKIYFNDPILLTNLSVSLTALSMKNDVPNLSKLDISSLNSSSVVSL